MRPRSPYFVGVNPDFSLNNPYVVVGLLFGGPAAVSVRRDGHDCRGPCCLARSWRKCARQFREKPGIMKGTDKPDYGKAVDLLTKARD